MILQATNVHKFYGPLHVIKGVNLSIEKNEIVSIVGKSGAGKTTLLHILGTLDNPDEGKVTFKNKDISFQNPRILASIRNESMGFIFQFHHLLSEFTALENTMIPALIGRKSESEAKEKAEDLLKYLGLSERLHHKPSQLSGGEQQRVAVARSLINDPEIVFADEPSGNLDTSTSEELHNLIFKLRKDRDQTFIIVTHNPILSDMSDRTLKMEDGLFVN